MNWYVKAWKNFFVFSGRARRKEYWMFALFNFIILIALSIVESTLGIPYVLTTIYDLAIFIPSLAVAVRRLHDTGKTGWWLLLGLIPVIGAIILLVFMCLESDEGENEYGPNPKH